jgi:predicted RNA-binding protein Jag
MYDENTEAKEFYGDNVAEATASAVSYFGRPEAEITVKTLDEVFGLGARTVVVAQPTDMIGKASSGGGGDRGDRGERRPRDRDRGGRDGDRGGRGDRGDRGGRGRERERRPSRDREPVAADAAPPIEPTAPSVGTAQGEIGELGAFVLGVVERMDVGPFEISAQTEDNFAAFQISGEAAEALGSGDGRAPEALQLLANQAAGMIHEDPPRVVVDVEGNREKREAFLARVADRAAKRALDTGRSVALDPMNGKDRRGIHVALRDTDQVATMSIGEGGYRQVLVVPEGAAEWDEAQSANEQASD